MAVYYGPIYFLCRSIQSWPFVFDCFVEYFQLFIIVYPMYGKIWCIHASAFYYLFIFLLGPNQKDRGFVSLYFVSVRLLVLLTKYDLVAIYWLKYGDTIASDIICCFVRFFLALVQNTNTFQSLV